MSSRQGAPHELVGAYLLGAVSPSEVAEFELHLQTCSECQAEIGQMEPALQWLGEAIAIEPSRSFAPDLATEVAGDASSQPSAVPDQAGGIAPNRRRFRGAAIGAAMAVAASLLGLAGFLTLRQDSVTQVQEASDVIAVRLEGESVPGVEVLASTEGVALLNQRFESPPVGERYALWSIGGEQDAQPEFIGWVKIDQESNARQSWDVDATDAVVLAISLEPPEAEQIPSAPLGTVLLSGELQGR